jgi:hypothetical protein
VWWIARNGLSEQRLNLKVTPSVVGRQPEEGGGRWTPVDQLQDSRAPHPAHPSNEFPMRDTSWQPAGLIETTLIREDRAD